MTATALPATAAAAAARRRRRSTSRATAAAKIRDVPRPRPHRHLGPRAVLLDGRHGLPRRRLHLRHHAVARPTSPWTTSGRPSPPTAATTSARRWSTASSSAWSPRPSPCSSASSPPTRWPGWSSRASTSSSGVILGRLDVPRASPWSSPLFQLFSNIGWLDGANYQALIIPNISFALPLTIYTLTAFFAEMPWELEESARIDGCTPGQAFRKIMLPLAAPGLFTTAILAFIARLERVPAGPAVLHRKTQPVTVAIAQFTGAQPHQEPYTAVMAAGTIVTVPLIIMVLHLPASDRLRPHGRGREGLAARRPVDAHGTLQPGQRHRAARGPGPSGWTCCSASSASSPFMALVQTVVLEVRGEPAGFSAVAPRGARSSCSGSSGGPAQHRRLTGRDDRP